MTEPSKRVGAGLLAFSFLLMIVGSAVGTRAETEQVKSVEVVAVEPTPEITPEPTPELTPEPTPKPTREPTPQPTPEPVREPEPTALPTPTPAPITATNPGEWGDCSLAYGYDNWDANIAFAVCMAESRGNPLAANFRDNHGSCIGSFGLMQVGCFWYPHYGYGVADYYNPRVNMEIANRIWQRQGGFQAWTVYTSGKYQNFLP